MPTTRPLIGGSSGKSLSRFFEIFSTAHKFQTTKSTRARASESKAASCSFRGSGAAFDASRPSSYWRHDGAIAVHRRSRDAASLAYRRSAVATSAAKAQSNPCRKNARDLSLSRARIQSFLLRLVGVNEATSSSYSFDSSSSSLRSSSLFCLRSLALSTSSVFLSSSSRPLSKNVSDGLLVSSRSRRPLPGGP